jgi:hypothetical protein
VTTAGGQTYKGQSVVDLRSDGAVVGLLLGGVLDPLRWLHVEVPVVLGTGQFGFYLTDEDRDTPDGRRVSEWENELLDGRDASGGFTIDVGVRLGLRFERLRWLRPYVGGNYSTVLGYDAFVTDDYSGFSFSVGFEVGAWGAPDGSIATRRIADLDRRAELRDCAQMQCP